MSIQLFLARLHARLLPGPQIRTPHAPVAAAESYYLELSRPISAADRLFVTTDFASSFCNSQQALPMCGGDLRGRFRNDYAILGLHISSTGGSGCNPEVRSLCEMSTGERLCGALHSLLDRCIQLQPEDRLDIEKCWRELVERIVRN